MKRAALLGFAIAVACSSLAHAASPRVLHRAAIGGPVDLPPGCPGVEDGVLSDAAPLVGNVPGHPRRLRAVYQAHGERLQLSAASRNGGRTWSRKPIPDATQCLGGPSDHNLSVNPLFDVGAGGVAWFGESWFNDPAEDFELWSYGVELHQWSQPSRAWRPGITPPPPDESSQNLAIAAHPRDRGEVALAWTHIDQVPNPISYAPTGTELRFAVRDDGRWITAAVVHDTSADQLVVNPRLGRLPGGEYLAIFDQGALADLPGALLGLTATTLPLYATRSADGEAWSRPVRIGAPEMFTAADPEGESDARVGSAKPDLAIGPNGRAAAVWVEGSHNTVRLARSDDGGRTWSAPENTVSLEGPGIQPAVAFDRRGRLGLFYYDAFSDHVRDGAWMLQPRFAVRSRRGRWNDVALSKPFDARRAESCPGGACESHASALGVYQDVEGLRQGFGVGYTVGPPVARDGRTDARYARIVLR